MPTADPAQPFSQTPATGQTPATPAAIPPELRIPVSDLERRAAEVRRRRAQQEAEAVPFAVVLAQPCPEHNAPPGKPCWRVSPDDLHQRPAKAVCGKRVTQAMGVAQLRREREQRAAEREAERARRKRSRGTAE